MSVPSIKIFLAYARKDAEYMRELKKHFAPLERNNNISIWCDNDIEAGENWEQSIKTALQNADIVLLLVSADAIASNYFYNEELPKALIRENNQEAKVIPIIIRPCNWELTSLKNLQALPFGGKPISTWGNHDSAYNEIVSRINQIIPEIERKKAIRETAEKERLEQDRLKAEKAAKLKLARRELEKAQSDLDRNKKRIAEIDQNLKSLQDEQREKLSKLYELEKLITELSNRVSNLESNNFWNRNY